MARRCYAAGMAAEKVTVFGGTGFLGLRIVSALLSAGHEVRVAARHPERGDPAWRDPIRALAGRFQRRA